MIRKARTLRLLMLLGCSLPLAGSWQNSAQAENVTSPSGKSPIIKPKPTPIQVNEPSTDFEKFTDVVRSVAPGEDLVEVQFKKRRGIHYARKNQSTIEILAKSQKTGATVTFEIDDNDLIQSVQLNKSEEEGSEEEDFQKVMKQILGP